MKEDFTDAMKKAIAENMKEGYGVTLEWYDRSVKIWDEFSSELITYSEDWHATVEAIDHTAKIIWMKRQRRTHYSDPETQKALEKMGIAGSVEEASDHEKIAKMYIMQVLIQALEQIKKRGYSDKEMQGLMDTSIVMFALLKSEMRDISFEKTMSAMKMTIRDMREVMNDES